jgi:soluble lytic murein transglycosylase
MKRGVTPVKKRRSQTRKIVRRLLSGSATALILSLAIALGGIQASLAADDDVETAALAPGQFRPTDEVPLPQPLKEADAQRYRRIFHLQDEEHWAEADREIAKLHDKRLLGHVLAQRYLSPKGYHSKFVELSHWLARYADEPDAPQIYRLALSRMPRGAKHPRRPEGGVFSAAIAGTDVALASREDSGKLSAVDKRRLVELRRLIRHKIDEGAYNAAERLLSGKEAQRLLDSSESDQLRADIVSGYYFLNRDREALAVADSMPVRPKRVNATAEWAGGLAAWRLHHYEKAAEHFERLATADSIDPWTRSASAYWTARSRLRQGAFDKVTHWLEVGANFPYTFYGILSRKLVGKPFDYNWELPAFSRADAARLSAIPAGMRAFALIQVGEERRAERELRRVNPAEPAMAHALLAVSQRADMPTLGMLLADQIPAPGSRRYDAALYPMPSWEPQGGYSVDRALVFALIRQESKFSARAMSSVGARGVMQLMPGTARFVADGTEYGGQHHQLFDPELNIALGQNYLAHLMGNDAIGNNLFMLVAAYNGGPGNLARWQRRIKHDGDPLLFLESIPNHETRQFVEHVLANYWIYRDQLGQPAPGLDAIAEGQWPTYKSAEGNLVPAVASNGGN